MIGDDSIRSRWSRPGIRRRTVSGNSLATRSNGAATITESAGTNSPDRSMTPATALVALLHGDRPDSGGQADLHPVRLEPGFEAAAVKLAERDQGDLHPVAVAVPQEAVDEDLAGVADVHLVRAAR